MSVRGRSTIWTEQSIRILREMYPTNCAQDIADVIGCSDCTVNYKAREMGLRKAPGYNRNDYCYRFTRKGRYKKEQ